MDKYREIKIEDYSYELPSERIAKHPVTPRDSSKLLLFDGSAPTHTLFRSLPDLLPADSLLVFNDTKVIHARLLFRKPTGARIEVFCLSPCVPSLYEQALSARQTCTWYCLVGNARKWHDEVLSLPYDLPDGSTCHLRVRKISEEAASEGIPVCFEWDKGLTFGELLSLLGELPIPPYLNRKSEPIDVVDYQTIYATHEGSVAAPTAGLHFTDEVFARMASKGIQTQRLTLHVGVGTFRPVKSETIGAHKMHNERISVSIDLLHQLRASLGRVVAVGTTSTRTLESLYYMGVHLLEGRQEPFRVRQWEPYEGGYDYTTEQVLDALILYLDRQGGGLLLGETEILIVPGFRYRLVDRLITNFHQPHSTLLLLIASFVGEQWRTIYRYALEHGFRFLSYGDSSLLQRVPYAES